MQKDGLKSKYSIQDLRKACEMRLLNDRIDTRTTKKDLAIVLVNNVLS